MLRPRPRVCGWVPTLPSWPPGPAFCSVRPTDRRGHGDSKLGGSSGRAAPGLGHRGGSGLSPPRGGARSPAPVRRPSLAGAVRVQETGAAGATPSQGGTPGLPGLPGPRPMDCAVGKDSRSFFGPRHYTIAWLLPFPASALAHPRGLQDPDPSTPWPQSPNFSVSDPWRRVSASALKPEALATPPCLYSMGSLCQGPRPLIQKRFRPHSPLHLPLLPAQSPRAPRTPPSRPAQPRP